MAISSDPNDPNFGLEMDDTSPNFGLPQEQEPSGVGTALRNAGEAAIETVKGFIPTTPKAVAEFATPVVTAIEDIGKAGRSLYDVAFGGKSVDQSVIENYPESQILSEAEKTPAFSKERFAAGFGVLSQLGMGALIGKSIRPTLRELAFGKEPVVSPEVTPQTPEPTISETVPPITETIKPEAQPVPGEVTTATAEPIPKTEPIERPIGTTAKELLDEWDKASSRGDNIAEHVIKRTIERLSTEEREAGVELRLNPKPPEEVIPSATQEGQIAESNIVERAGDGEGGASTETSGSGGAVAGAEVGGARSTEAVVEPAAETPVLEVGTEPAVVTESAAVPPKTGVSKIGQSIEAKAVEAKLTKGFSETALYDPVSIGEQSQLATDLVRDNLPLSRSIVRGEAPLPGKLQGVPLITAMEEHLTRNPDARVAYELANSPLTSATSAAAQSLRLMRERVPDGISAKFQEIREARTAGAKLRGETPEIVTESIHKEVLKQSSKRPTWEAFVREIVC